MDVPSLRRYSLSGRYWNQIFTERALEPAGESGRVKFRTRAWFNENPESRNFFVAGVLVIVRGIFLKGMGGTMAADAPSPSLGGAPVF